MNSRRFSGAVVGIVIGSLLHTALAQSPQHPPTKHHRPSANTTEDHADTHDSRSQIAEQVRIPFVMSITQSLAANPKIWSYEYQTHTEESPSQYSWEEISVVAQGIFSCFLFIVGVVQAILASLQYRTYERQRRIMEEQAKILARQADLDTPRLFAMIQSDTLIESIGSPENKLYTTHNTIVMNCVPTIVFVLRNYGRSPAILRYINVKIDRGTHAPPENTAYVLIDLPRERILGSGESSEGITAAMTSLGKGQILRQEYDDLMGGRTYWWLFGSVGFDDVWDGQNEFHFCWRYDQSLRVFDPYPAERNYTQTKKREPRFTKPSL